MKKTTILTLQFFSRLLLIGCGHTLVGSAMALPSPPATPLVFATTFFLGGYLTYVCCQSIESQFQRNELYKTLSH